MFVLLMTTLSFTDKAPEDADVKAGWTALIVFLLLIAAVVVLSFSLVKQLRKAQAAKDSGVYGDEPVDDSVDNGADNGADDQR
ncbi:hypothetical protein [Nocardioides sp. InS609-2]|uniref:hypothetical protein n=1 Tax=Nocardioides sp. InS609-2 TaxID=2760705 RepID=UPI0020BF2157|nr:hypothetical protein [Nocardioides sp. InS609-2]